jgi:hypothetical protein
MHAIVWKCANGHREERRYCGIHITVMTAIAMRVLRGDWNGTPVCSTCYRDAGLVPILPVIETPAVVTPAAIKGPLCGWGVDPPPGRSACCPHDSCWAILGSGI